MLRMVTVERVVQHFISIVFLTAGAVLVACTPKYTYQVVDNSLKGALLKDSHEVIRNNRWVFALGESIALGNLEVVGFDEQQMPRNQAQLNVQLREQFSARFVNVLHTNPKEDKESLFNRAYYEQVSYLIEPRLVAIENNRNTFHELSAGAAVYPDRPRETDNTVLQFIVYEVNTRRVVDTAFVKSRQRLYAANHSITADLFYGAVASYLNTISGARIN